MYTLEITESADVDLDQITDYIGNVLANPPAALALLDEVERVSDTLETTPEIFPLCSDSRLAGILQGSVPSFQPAGSIPRGVAAERQVRPR